MSTLNAMHTTVGKADEGDAGWMWWEGEWRLSTIIYDENDDVDYVAAIINDECRPFEVGSVSDLPWLPISRPPYEGDDRPCTHALTLQDREASWTLSWHGTEEEGAAISRSVFQHAQSLLKLDKATGSET